MKTKKLKNPIFLLYMGISFFLGRESKELSFFDDPELHQTSITETPPENSNNFQNILQLEHLSDTVYRCGKSKVYHPTMKHGAFKICKSKVTKLLQETAIEKGLHHCSCPGNNTIKK